MPNASLAPIACNDRGIGLRKRPGPVGVSEPSRHPTIAAASSAMRKQALTGIMMYMKGI